MLNKDLKEKIERLNMIANISIITAVVIDIFVILSLISLSVYKYITHIKLNWSNNTIFIFNSNIKINYIENFYSMWFMLAVLLFMIYFSLQIFIYYLERKK